MAVTSWFTKKIGEKLGGAFNQNDNLDILSNGATKLIEDALEGFETNSPIVDYNANLIGVGTANTGCYVHPFANGGWKHPVATMKMKLVESASGIKNPNNWDSDYVTRLIELKGAITKSHGNVWGKQCVYALDQYHDRFGLPVPDNTATFVPNQYAYDVANDNPALKDHFVPCVSIHPYRRDAVQELKKWIKCGVRIVKWIPSVQGIDPSNERCDGFYKEMAKRKVILHCGGDRVLFDPPGMDLSLENPLLLRRPLSFGVKVIISHCASEGKSLDLENPPHVLVDNLHLFFRLMEEPKYVGLLFGDISGICNFTRVECLQPLLDYTELHNRLVYGSDYPVPAVNLVVQTYWFANKGLVAEKACDFISEIYKTNPLLFDFVVKRTLKSKNGNKFNISIFKEHPDLLVSPIADNFTEEAEEEEEELPAPPSPERPHPSIITTTGEDGGNNEDDDGDYGDDDEDGDDDKPRHQNQRRQDNRDPAKRSTASPSISLTSPKFSITTPPSPAIRLSDPGSPNFHMHAADEDEGLTEEVVL
jgi:predicted TIM-barrel fold metal-dependent hydrolase